MKKIWILWTFLIISMLLTFMLGSCGASSGTDETGPGADLPESLGSESQGSESTDASGIIEDVNLKIRALPDPYALTKADYPAVEEALEAYKALTDSQRASVEAALVEKLRSLEAKMSEPDVKRTVHVTDAPYGAVGDGRTDDRPAIQSAIDDMAQNGGGIVLLDAGKTFVSGNLWLKSHVELRFEDGAKLKQSADPDAYVELQEDGTYAPFQMTYGHVIYPEREWDVGSCYNYPFLFARDIEDFKVTGNGIIEMVRGRDCSDTLHICPIVLNYADRFELSGFTVQNYNAWAINCRMSTNGLFEGITIKDATDGAADGIGIMCSQNIRVTGCHLITSDDGIKVSCTYGDPRRGPWMQEFTPIPCRNIEIDHNHCVVTWDATKAFCFFAWGSAYENLNAVEISDVYVHDNYFKTMGVWTGNWNLKTHKFEYNGSTSPVKSIRFENNTIDLIQDNFYTLPISDVYGFDCMPTLKNGDFSDGSVYWIFRDETASGVDEEGFGYIDSFDRADPAIYQGLKLLSDVTYTFSGKVRATGQGARLFVKEQASGQLIASAECTSIDFETVTLTFKVPKDGNYHIGLERGNAKEGSAAIDDASLTAEMYVDVPEGSENILSTQKPDLLTAGDGINDMLGIAFSTTADGVITHVRMYTGAQESGVRLVGLWEEKTGKLLLDDILQWPITTGLEGWKYYELPKPVKVTKGTAYVVGVSTGPAGKYVKGTGQLASPLENGHLVTYSNSGRWRDIQNFSVDMPEHTGSSHYFRDIVFLPGDTFVPSVDERILALPDEITWEDRADVEAARAAYDALTDEQKTQVKHLDKLLAAEARIEELKPEMEFISILTTQTPVNVSNTFGGVRLFLGTLFSPKTSGVVTTVRAYIGPKESGTHYVALWEYDTAKLLTGSVLEWNIEAGKEGWQEFILPESVKLSSGTKYVVAVSAGPNVFSAQTPSSYATFPVNNAFFTTYAKSSLWADMAVHGQNMPASLSGECYFRDIIFVPDDPNG